MEIHNLRFNSEEGAYRPVGAPAVVSERAWCGITTLPSGDGMTTEFVCDGTTLGAAVYPMRDCPTEPVEIGELSFEPRRAVEVSEGYLIIGDGAKALVVRDERGLFRICNPDTKMPDPLVETRSATTISQPFPSLKLTEAYDSHSTTLSAADTDTLTKAVGKCYREMAAEAAAAGLFIQAVLVRLAMYDAQGNLIHRSSPVLHTVPSGNLMPTAFYVGISPRDAMTTDTASMSMEAYRLFLRLPACGAPTDLMKRVARLDVELSPQIHLPALGMKAPSRIVAATGEQLRIEARMPGSTLPAESLRLRMLQAVAADDTKSSVARSIAHPFRRREADELLPVHPLQLTVDEETARIAKGAAAAKPAGADAVTLSRLSVPHTVTPGEVAAETDIALIGNPSVRLGSGESLDAVTHERGAIDTVDSAVIVEFEGGKRRVVRHDTDYATGMPLKLSPLYVYPDPTATSVTFLAMGADGSCRKLTVPLTPCGTFAYWLADDLQPVALEAAPDGEEFNVPADVEAVIGHPGTLVAARAGYPFSPLSVLRLEGDIRGIYPAPRPASSSWETGSPRYIVVGTGGIWSVGVNTSGRLTRPVLLDSRPVTHSGGVAPGSTSTGGSRLYIIAGGDLVAVSSNKVSTIKRRVGAVMLAWSGAHAELALITPGADRAEVYSVDSGSWSTRSLSGVTATMSTGAATRLTSPVRGYLDPDRELGGSVLCSLGGEADLPAGRHPFRRGLPVAEVIADMNSSAAVGRLELSGSYGALSYVTLSGVEFSGKVNAPIAHRVLVPYRYRLRYLLEGQFAADTRIYSIKTLSV